MTLSVENILFYGVLGLYFGAMILYFLFVAVKKEARWGEFKDTLKDAKKKIRTTSAEDGTLRVVTEDGEIVPGVTATAREPKFTVKCK